MDITKWSMLKSDWLYSLQPKMEKLYIVKGLGEGGEGDDRGWDGWMASPTRWTWIWVNSRSWWWRGRPGVLWFMGSQRVGPDWGTELNWSKPNFARFYTFFSSGQVLLSSISWCSSCTSVSEGVFLMYPWRDMYSMSTYSSAILFSHPCCLVSNLCWTLLWPHGL